jgi:hypothetical protein
VIVHTIRRGLYMRTLRPTFDPAHHLDIAYLCVSDMGHIVLYCTETNTLGKVVRGRERKCVCVSVCIHFRQHTEDAVDYVLVAKVVKSNTN